MKSDRVTFFAGLLLLFPAWLGFATAGPTILSPLPALTIVPALVGLSYGGVLVPVVGFFAWNPGLFRGAAPVPKRSYWLLSVLIVLSLFWFAASWRYGTSYQGLRHTYSVACGNFAWIVVLVAAFLLNKKRKATFQGNLLLHWLLFAWLGWYAFPYLGELP